MSVRLGIATRLWWALVTLFGIGLLAFFIIQLMPGADATAVRRSVGLERPFPLAFLLWAASVVSGNLGASSQFGRPVGDVLSERLLPTASLAVAGVAAVWVVGYVAGAWPAARGVAEPLARWRVLRPLQVALVELVLAFGVISVAIALLGIDLEGPTADVLQDAPWSPARVWGLLSQVRAAFVILGIWAGVQIARALRARLLPADNRVDDTPTSRPAAVDSADPAPLRVALIAGTGLARSLVPFVVSATAIASMALDLPALGPALGDALIGQDVLLIGGSIALLGALTVVLTLVLDVGLLLLDSRGADAHFHTPVVSSLVRSALGVHWGGAGILGFLLRRAAMAGVTLWVISGVAFLVVRFRAPWTFRTDESLVVQYVRWASGIWEWNFGWSYEYSQPVAVVIADRLWQTIALAMAALILMWLVAIPVGIYSAVRRNSGTDYGARVVGFIGVAVPDFLIALIVMYLGFAIFNVRPGGLFSSGEMAAAPWSLARVWDMVMHLPLPAVIIGLAGTAQIIRILRANLLDELHKPYLLTARAKGLGEVRAVLKYPVRVALNPVASLGGFILPFVVSGTVIVSIVMDLPTLGPVLLRSIVGQDFPLAAAIILLLGLLTVIGTFISDLALLWLDPRIRYSARA